MSLPPGTRVGAYAVTGTLGAGGMGEVYRAHDARLGRDVAMKVLPADVAGDTDRLARFEREARTLASLNHPNIAHVYGFEERTADGNGPFLVMELLEGQPLSDLLGSGPVPTRKAIDYACQIARGLAAAHDRGIVHRDLKPANLFVLPDGRVKILDFGLAAQARARSETDATLETFDRHTDPGTVLGTPGYMAPEQVRAEPTDARTDLFSLGVVLYEMLSGRRAFRRDTTADTIAAVLREDPPELATGRPDITPGLDRIVRRCLEKRPEERFQSARDLAFALDGLSASPGSGTALPAAAPATVDAAPRRFGRERIAWIALVAALGAVAVWLARSPAGTTAPPIGPYRTSVLFPVGLKTTELGAPGSRLALSPDGRHVAFVGGARGEFRPPDRLWLLDLQDGTARELDGTLGAWGPSWSPDGQQIAFTNIEANVVKRVSVRGGTPLAVQQSAGATTWTDVDHLLWMEVPRGEKVQLINIADGTTTDLPPVEKWLLPGFPLFVPGTRTYLYSMLDQRADVPKQDGVLIQSLDGGPPATLMAGAEPANPKVSAGYLLFVIGPMLYAQPFDAATGTLGGARVPLADNVLSTRGGGAAFSVSDNGALVYVPIERENSARLQVMRRDGTVETTIGDPADFSNVALSPDGTRAAVSMLDPARANRDVYIADLARGVRQRLTTDELDERSMAWMPDGRRLVYRKGQDLFVRRADFTGQEEPLLVDGTSKDPQAVAPDGRLLVRVTGERSNDLWIVPTDGKGAPVPLLSSRFEENYASFSPDGRSMVYASNESGRPEVYVMALDGSSGRTLLSTSGGWFPRWRRDGREIVYLSPEQMLMSVPVSGSGASFTAGTPSTLFRFDAQPGPGNPFDVTPDGQRFVVISRVPTRVPPSLTLLINWPEMVRRATSSSAPGDAR